MADRCLLFAAAAAPDDHLPHPAAVGLCEVGYHFPALFKVLVSANTRACRSLIFDDHDGPSAIAGDASEGLAKLKALRAQGSNAADAKAGIDAAIEHLSQPYLRDFPIFVLEPGELFGLSPRPVGEQLEKLLTEIRTLRIEDVVNMAADADWPTIWTDFLSYEPPNSVRAPIDPRASYMLATPSYLLQHEALLASCAAEAVMLDFEHHDPQLEAAVAALAALPNLSRLSLGGRTAPLPRSISALHNLRELGAGEMGLTELPESIGSLDQLECVYLQRNAFDRFPDQLRPLKRLRILSLWGNNLGSIPSWIGELPSLEQLLLDGCNLSQLPDELFALPALERLELARNPALTTLPEAVGNLKALKTLSMFQCGLRKLPESLSRISTLQRLGVGENHIDSVPPAIRNTRLEIISLSGNPLKRYPWTRWTYRARKVFL